MSEFLRKRAGAKISIILLSIFLFLFLFSTVALAETLEPGDINGDGKINVLDVVLVLQHVLEIDDPPLTEAQKKAADVNHDGLINVLDVTLIMQKALGLIDDFPLKDIVDTLIAADDFETLVAAVVEADLVAALRADGPFTVFAPTDEAFDDLLDDLGITVEELLDLDNLADILLYHVVAGSYSAADVVAAAPIELVTLQGDKISVTVANNKVFVNGAEVVEADIFCSNGVIHAIDEVLLPPLDELEVVGLSIIDAKTIGVEFNRAPTSEELGTVKFKVTKFETNAVVTTIATWDGKLAKLARDADLSYTPGKYVVEVTGIVPEFSGTVTITEPTPTSLEIRATSIPDDTIRAPLRVKLLDQYGEELILHPGQFTWTAINLTNSVDVTHRISFDPVAEFVIDTETLWWEFNLGDEVQISFVHTPSTLSKTVVLPVTHKTQLASITFGDVILPAGATHLTSAMQNVRIPILEAKDQYGNDMFLVNGANVDLLSSDQLIIIDGDLSFVTVGGVQHVNIAMFQDKGTVTISVMGTPGVVGSKTITVLESVPYQLEVVSAPETTIVEGKSTLVKFDVLDQFGNRITTDKTFYQMIVVKTSADDLIITTPTHLQPYTISQAVVDIPIEAGLVAPDNETITFRLQKTDNTFIDSKTFSFNIVTDIDGIEVSVDKSEYQAGDEIEVMVKATIGGVVHTDYNLSGLATITVFDGGANEFYFRTLTFENGIATTKVPAKIAAANIQVDVDYDGFLGSSGQFEIVAGPASKFLLTGNTSSPDLGVALTDAYNNPILDFEGVKILRITYPVSITPLDPVSAEGDIEVTFTAGEGTITFGAWLVPGTYTVSHAGYAGSLIIP